MRKKIEVTVTLRGTPAQVLLALQALVKVRGR